MRFSAHQNAANALLDTPDRFHKRRKIAIGGEDAVSRTGHGRNPGLDEFLNEIARVQALAGDAGEGIVPRQLRPQRKQLVAQ